MVGGSPAGLVATKKKKKYLLWSQIRQDNPLNLSISVSGGKETNQDSPSNGE